MRIDYPLKLNFAAILLIVVLGIAAYANTLHAPFTFDDDLSIVGNPDIRSLDKFWSHNDEMYPHRLVAYRTFALNYYFGGFDVTGFHLVNILVHLASALLVYTLLRLTFRTPFFLRQIEGEWQVEGEAAGRPSSWFTLTFFIPLFAALLFVVHPVQTQAVTYIVQRITSLATFFYLLSVVLYVVARLWMERKTQGRTPKAENASQPQPATFRFLLPLTGSVLAAILAMKTKEIAVTLPLAIVLCEFFFFHGAWRRRLLCLLPILATLPIIPLSVLAVGESAGDFLADVSEKSVAADLSRFDYFFTQLRVIVTYLRLLILPVNQNVDYDYPIYTTFFTPPVFWSFLLLVAIFGLAVYLFWRTRPALYNQGDTCVAPTAQPGSRRTIFTSPQPPAPELRLIAFGILWFFLALSVESSIIPITDVIFEHRLYLPSFGAVTVFATGFYLVGRRLSGRLPGRWPAAVALLIITALAGATLQRNQLWASELGLWQDAAAKSPGKGRPLNNFAVALEDVGRRGEAIEVLERAVSVEPTYYRSWYNLGDLLLVSGSPERALEPLRQAIAIKPDFTAAYVKQAAALLRSRRYDELVSFVQTNFDLLSGNAEARFYLGAAHAFLGNRQAALEELVVIADLDPSLAATLRGLLGRRQ